MKKLPLLSLAALILVFWGGFFAFAGQASAQYCGDSLRLDPIRCDVLTNAAGVKYCEKVQLSGPQYVSSCTGDPNNCTTKNNVSGSVNGCTGPFWVPSLNESICHPTSKKADCWVNPGDPPPPPPPSNDICGKACSSSSECSGLTCAPAKVCWGSSCDTGESVAKHRIRVKAYNCNNQAQSGVKIKAWGNNCTTGSDGTCIVSKNVPCQDSVGGGDQLATSVVAGKDTADPTQANYYSRVDSPSFNRGSCSSNINCNYNRSPLTSSPYREAYYISPENKSENEFGWLFCSWGDADANTGFDFKQISGCPPPPTPTPTLSPPTCTKNNWPTSISATGTGTFSVTGTDPDSVSGPTDTRVDFVFTKQLTDYCSPGEGNAVDGQWQQLGGTHWNTLSASETLNNATLNLPAGTYMMTANLRDNDNQFSTGNPGTPKGCGWSYNDCNGDLSPQKLYQAECDYLT